MFALTRFEQSNGKDGRAELRPSLVQQTSLNGGTPRTFYRIRASSMGGAFETAARTARPSPRSEHRLFSGRDGWDSGYVWQSRAENSPAFLARGKGQSPRGQRIAEAQKPEN
jgi:hypothetical protein